MAAAINGPLHPQPDTTPRVSSTRVSRRYFNPHFSLSLFSSSSSKPLRKVAAEIGRNRPICGAAARSDMAMEEEKTVTDERMLVMVPPHPLIKHWISVLRNEKTPCAIFKNALAELGRLLIYEASRDWLPTISGEIQTPMGVANVEFVDPREPVLVIPILRAGLALAELAPSVLPATKTFHLGMRRDETTLLPSTYLNNLPDKFSDEARLLVVDPMLATVWHQTIRGHCHVVLLYVTCVAIFCFLRTEEQLYIQLGTELSLSTTLIHFLPLPFPYLMTGGTIVAALNLLKDRGVANKQIKVISAVAAPPALEKLSKKFPGLRVYTGMIDPVVNERGFIVPGLGDSGNRSFGT